MRLTNRIPSSLFYVVIGFGLGASSWALLPDALAQDNAPEPGSRAVDISDANAEKIKQADAAIAVAQTALIQDGKYTPAIKTNNPYVILAGGVDAIADLEAGRGVDPVTFAGLYNGQAVDDVLPHLANDAVGRLTYKGKLVRMYPVDKMKELDTRRTQILDIAAGGSGSVGGN